MHKTILDSDSSDGMNPSDGSITSLKNVTNTNESTDSDGTDTNKAEATYQQTKDMCNEDCKVILSFWWPFLGIHRSVG